uniref:Uncharacterized protein n=1 Tax=Cucumis melo TaxID=3656 RepID=A0A9I9EGH0_CUCME
MLVWRGESLSQRISPDVLLDAVWYVGKGYPDVLFIFVDVFWRREYPVSYSVSCSLCRPLYITSRCDNNKIHT